MFTETRYRFISIWNISTLFVISFYRYFYFIFMSILPYIYACVPHACHVPSEARRGHLIPGN